MADMSVAKIIEWCALYLQGRLTLGEVTELIATELDRMNAPK